MKLFPQDNNVVLYKTGFEDDILERISISSQLSTLVERFEDPVVIALDDKWGSGKTYFLKRWVAAHKIENGGSAVTVYFDAFENDYLSDPLVSIITAVSERIPDDQKTTLEKWKSVATKLAKPTFGIALSLATFGAKKYFDEIGDVLVDAASSEARDVSQNLWDAEKERKDAIKEFKELLVKLTEEESAPIVIVVDELDRCRPDYALLVLETIKHFFSVPKVHFILGVNTTALENSVKATYGADIDAERYLRKFVNVAFALPRFIGAHGDRSVVRSYTAQLISEMGLPSNVSNQCADLISHVAARNDVSLRDIGSILSKIALLPKEVFEVNQLRGWIDVLCVLLVSSVVDPKLHKKLVSASASIDEIRDFLGASETKTTANINGVYNENHNKGLTVWLVHTVYTCSSGTVNENTELPKWSKDVGMQFGHFDDAENPKGIPSQIQRDWLDLFRI